jgi:hypothetical protein
MKRSLIFVSILLAAACQQATPPAEPTVDDKPFDIILTGGTTMHTNQ